MPETSELLWLVVGAVVFLALVVFVVRRDWLQRREAIESGRPPTKANLRFVSSLLSLLAIISMGLTAASLNVRWLVAVAVAGVGAVTCWVLAERQPDEMARPTPWGTRSHAERKYLRKQEQSVAQLLDSQWDPIGVYQDDERPVPGEYASFAWEVLAHLHRGDSETEIAALLTAIKAQSMGLGPGPEDARAARALVAWFRDV